MKLGYTILYVRDVMQTMDFYREAFGIQEKFRHDGGDYAELDTGMTTLAFASYSLAEANGISFVKTSKEDPGSPAFEIAFVSSDVQGAYARAVEKGAISVAEPAEKPWGQLVGYVKDLNGFLVEICSPIG